MYPEKPKGIQVIVGSTNMGYDVGISDATRARFRNLSSKCLAYKITSYKSLICRHCRIHIKSRGACNNFHGYIIINSEHSQSLEGCPRSEGRNLNVETLIIIIIIMNFYSPVSNTRCHSIGHKMRIARIKIRVDSPGRWERA